MTQYIDKDALVAEIKRLIKNAKLYIEHHHDHNDKLRYSFEHQRLAMCELLSFINTLEVKEMDLEIDALRTEYEKGRHDAIAGMSKFVWSEEDERKLELLKALIEDAKEDSTSYSTMFREMDELNNWLESFKYRVQSLNHVIK